MSLFHIRMTKSFSQFYQF